MRKKVCAVLLAGVMLLANGVPAAAQLFALTPSGGSGASSGAPTINSLKEDIRGLEAALNNPTATPAMRESAEATLQSQRVQLYALLKKRVSVLRSYHTTVTSEAEKSVLERDIRGKLGELRLLEQDMQVAPVARPALRAATPAAGTPLRAAPPQQAQSFERQVQTKIDEVVEDVSAATSPGDKVVAANLMATKADVVMFALMRKATNESISNLIDNVEETRVDKEMGSGGDDSSGGTSLVTKGATPAILGFAVENGALTRDISGTTITFRGNLVGIAEALRNQGFLESYRDDSPGTRWLRKLSFGFSFDTDRGSQPGTFLADRQQLSSYTLRYEFINDRDPRSPMYERRWRALADADFQPLLNTLAQIVATEPRLTTWSINAATAIGSKVTAAAIREEIGNQLNNLPPLNELSAESQLRVRDFVTQYENFLTSRKNLLNVISKGALMTFEFKGNRRPGLVDTSNLKFIAEGDVLRLFGFGNGTTELTYNGSMTFFNSSPGAGMSRVRDFDHSLQLDVPFPVRNLGSFVLTFAGKYKRIMEDEAMTGTTPAVMATKGDMAVGQFKLTVPVKGVRIPLSFSFANRTEFLQEREVKGQIGFTLDMDAFFSKWRP